MHNWELTASLSFVIFLKTRPHFPNSYNNYSQIYNAKISHACYHYAYSFYILLKRQILFFQDLLLKFDDNAHQDHDYEISRELKQIQKKSSSNFYAH